MRLWMKPVSLRGLSPQFPGFRQNEVVGKGKIIKLWGYHHIPQVPRKNPRSFRSGVSPYLLPPEKFWQWQETFLIIAVGEGCATSFWHPVDRGPRGATQWSTEQRAVTVCCMNHLTQTSNSVKCISPALVLCFASLAHQIWGSSIYGPRELSS